MQEREVVMEEIKVSGEISVQSTSTRQPKFAKYSAIGIHLTNII